MSDWIHPENAPVRRTTDEIFDDFRRELLNRMWAIKKNAEIPAAHVAHIAELEARLDATELGEGETD